jgi:hypothetical protein
LPLTERFKTCFQKIEGMGVLSQPEAPVNTKNTHTKNGEWNGSKRRGRKKEGWWWWWWRGLTGGWGRGGGSSKSNQLRSRYVARVAPWRARRKGQSKEGGRRDWWREGKKGGWQLGEGRKNEGAARVLGEKRAYTHTLV